MHAVIEAAFTRLRFQHKNEHLVTILAFHLHTNDEKHTVLKTETFESRDLSGDLETDT